MIRDVDFFVNYAELPSKEFLKRCDQYLRVKGGSNANSNGRSAGTSQPGLTSPIIGSAPFVPSASMSSMQLFAACLVRDSGYGQQGHGADQRLTPQYQSLRQGRCVLSGRALADIAARTVAFPQTLVRLDARPLRRTSRVDQCERSRDRLIRGRITSGA